jgi:hypothetical protein
MALPTLPVKHSVGPVFRMTGLLVALLGVSSICGLTLGRHGWYDTEAATFPAFVSQDAVTLVLGAPLLAGTAWLARRGSLRGLLCWTGTLFYIAYSYSFYLLGARVTPLFPVYIGIVSIGMYGTLALLFSLDLPNLAARVDSRMPVRGMSGFLMAIAIFFAGLWLWLTGMGVANDVQLDLVTRTVIAVDGVVLLPLLFFGGLWLWRRTPIGFALAGLLLMKVTATFLTLLINSAVTAAWGHAVDSVQTTAFLIGFAVALAQLLWFLRHVDAPETGASGRTS